MKINFSVPSRLDEITEILESNTEALHRQRTYLLSIITIILAIEFFSLLFSFIDFSPRTSFVPLSPIAQLEAREPP